jgi:hypothetical protein
MLHHSSSQVSHLLAHAHVATANRTISPQHPESSLAYSSLDGPAKATEIFAWRLLCYVVWLVVVFLARAAVFMVLAAGYSIGKTASCHGDCDPCQSRAYLLTTAMEKQVPLLHPPACLSINTASRLSSTV